MFDNPIIHAVAQGVTNKKKHFVNFQEMKSTASH